MAKILIPFILKDTERFLENLTRFFLKSPNFVAKFDNIVKVLKVNKKIPNLVYYCFRSLSSRI